MSQDQEERRECDQWHLDKRVPIALIFALVMQTASIAWWAAGIDERMNTAEKRLSDYRESKERLLRLEIYQENLLKEVKGLRTDLSTLLKERRKEMSEDMSYVD